MHRTRYAWRIGICTLAFAPFIASAWTGPTGSPPTNNVAAPINVGTADQVRDGWLGLMNSLNDNALSVIGNLIMSGSNRYLNFGTTWGSSGYGFRDNAGIIEHKDSGSAWLPLRSFNNGIFVSGATSSFNTYGINLAGGCFAVNGVCVGGAGTPAAGGTGAVQFANGTAFAADAPNLFWDNTNNRLGIGTNAPGVALQVAGQVKITGGTPGAGKVLTSDAAGLASWATPSSGVTGSGTANYVTKFTGATALGNSVIYDNGTNVGIGTASPGAKLEVAGQVKITGGTPGAGKVLTSDAAGLASWATPSSGSVTAVTASSPLASSGGTAPNISFTGTLALANGGTGATTAAGARTNLGLGSLAILNTNGNTAQYLRGDGTWTTPASGGVTGSGTANYVPKFTGASTLGNSIIFDNGTNVGIGTASPVYRLHVVGPAADYAEVVNWPPGSANGYGIAVGTGAGKYSKFQNSEGYYTELAHSSYGAYTNGYMYASDYYVADTGMWASQLGRLGGQYWQPADNFCYTGSLMVGYNTSTFWTLCQWINV